MPITLNIIEPMQDEILLSYIIRLAHNNGFEYLPYFLGDIFPSEGAKLPYDISYDANEYFRKFCDCIDVPEQPTDFYLNHSIYPFSSLFMTKAKQTHFINLAFRGKNQYPEILTKMSGSMRQIRRCPECSKEDMERYGFTWIRRMHQLPGVHVCPVHKRPLDYTEGSPNKILSPDASYKSYEKTITEQDIAYAEFSKAILDANIDSDIEQVSSAVFARVNELGYTSRNGYKGFNDYIKRAKQNAFSHSNAVKFIRTSLVSPQYVDAEKCTSLLLVLFDDVESLSNALKDDTSELERFIDRTDGYELYEPYRVNIIEMKHISCGTDFITTPWGFSNGWRCPACDKKSTEDKLTELVSLTGDGEYDFVGGFSGMDNPVRIRHSCGREFNTKMRAFLEEGVRCECENKMTFEQAAEFVAEHGNGEYELIEYSSTEKPARIKHLTCGGVIQLDKFRTFMRHQRCPLCNPIYRDQESFAEDIKALVGDQYTLTGQYVDKTTYVKIRHNVCGKEQEYLPIHFIRGMRCSYCGRQIRDDRLSEMVSTISMGRYEVAERETYNLYRIHDNLTGKDVSLTRNQVLQELTRPTPSSILPLEQRADYGPILSRKELVFAAMEKQADENGLVFLSDIHMEDLSDDLAKNEVEKLAREKKIFRQGNGTYSLENRKYDAKTLIEAKYIVRNGHRIGFYSMEDLAFEFGIVDKKPESMHIITNLESYKTNGRRAKAFGVSFRIMGLAAQINDDNYQMLEVLHIIDAAYHYGWKYETQLKKIIQEIGRPAYDFQPYFPAFPERVSETFFKLYKEI